MPVSPGCHPLSLRFARPLESHRASGAQADERWLGIKPHQSPSAWSKRSHLLTLCLAAQDLRAPLELVANLHARGAVGDVCKQAVQLGELLE